MNNFYCFDRARKRGEILIESAIAYDEQALVSGRSIVSEPLPVKVSEGKKWFDLAHFQDPYNFALSRRVYDALIGSGMTGLRGYHIAINGVLSDYLGVQIVGRAGALVRPALSGFVQGYDFDPHTWDGTDFFMPAGTFLIFCTERARNRLLELGVTNVEMPSIRDVEWYSA